jgi:hypothetical protein
MPRGTRSREEDLARNQVRSFCARFKTKIYKTRSPDGESLVQVAPCEKWPQGILTLFNGWQDTLDRLVEVANNPDLVTDGIYVLTDDPDFTYEVDEAAE